MGQIDKQYTAAEIKSWAAGSTIEPDDVQLLRSASRMIEDSDNEWIRGYLICLSSTVAEQGVGTAERQRFRDVGEPTAQECRRLKLTPFDCKNLSLIRKAMK